MTMAITAQGNKRFFVSLLSLYTGVTAYGCGCSYLRYLSESQRISRNLEGLNSNRPLELTPDQHLHFPWYVDGIDNWEYQLVKVRGYFNQERFFVRKERNGKGGYIVLAPFITSTRFQDQTVRASGQNYPLEYGVMVSLGWVPEENLGDIQMTQEVLPLLVFPFSFSHLSPSEIPFPFILGDHYG